MLLCRNRSTSSKVAAAAAVALASLTTVHSAFGTILAGWDFQTTASGGTAISASPNTPTTFLANAGLQAGTAGFYLNGTNSSSTWLPASELTAFAGTAVNAGAGMSTATTTPAALAVLQGAGGSGANGKSVTFKLNMTGYQNLSITYAAQRTSTGFTTNTWEYSTNNGTSWSSVATLSSLPSSFATQTVTTTSGLNNISSALVRLTFTGATGTGTSGNNRLDNIVFDASAIPTGMYVWTGTGSGATWTTAATGHFTSAFTNDPTNDVTFTGTGESVTITGSVLAATMTFSPTSGAYTANSGTLSLAGSSSITVSGVNSATINSQVIGSNGLSKAGTGTLTLTNPAYTGATTVSAGVLVTSASTLTDLSVAAGATLTTTASSLTDTMTTPKTISGTINGSGAFSVVGPNSDGLTAANRGKIITINNTLTNTGGVSITAGTMLAKAGAYIPTTGTVTVGNWGQLQLDGTADGEVYGTTGQSWIINGQGDVTVTTSNTFVGGTSGALVGNKSVTVNSNVTMASNSTLAVTVAGKVMTLAGTFTQGAYELQKFGSGEVAITGAAPSVTSTGNTFIGNGKLTIGSSAMMGTGMLSLAQSGASLLNITAELNNPTQTVSNLTSQWAATSAGTTANGTQQLTLNGTALTVNQTVDTTFGAPFDAVNPTTTLTLAGRVYISGTGSLTKTGPAKLTLAGIGSIYTGPTTVSAGTLQIAGTYLPQGTSFPSTASLTVTGGTVSVSGSASYYTVNSATSIPVSGTLNIVSSAPTDISSVPSITGTGTTNVTAGTLNSTLGITQSTLALTGGAVVKIATNGTSTGYSKLGKLSVDSTSKLDITNNSAIITGTSESDVRTMITSGFNGGDWLGTGITSSNAANDNDGVTAVGYANNNDLGASDYNGVPLGATDTIVKYTYYGDADLSGTVTLEDFTQFLVGYQQGGTPNWINGDFDYSGTVTLEDFSLFLAGYQGPNTPLTPSLALALSADAPHSAPLAESISIVPEPTSLGLLAVGAMGLLRRRRK